MRVAIVDDEFHTRREIRRLLERYAAETGTSFQITEFADGLKEYFEIVHSEVIPTRKMPEITDEPIIWRYFVEPLNSMLRSLQLDEKEFVARAVMKIKARRPDDDYITVSVKGGARKIGVSSIDYVEVIDHDLFFHVGEELIETRGTISEVENKLASHHFFKCNKGCLINLAKVTGYHKSDVIVGKNTLPVSRARKKPLQEAIHEYLDGVT